MKVYIFSEIYYPDLTSSGYFITEIAEHLALNNNVTVITTGKITDSKSSVLNGVNIIKIQTYTAIFISVLNIPLSIFLAKFVGLGPPGVILATAISFFVDSYIKEIQYNKIIY